MGSLKQKQKTRCVPLPLQFSHQLPPSRQHKSFPPRKEKDSPHTSSPHSASLASSVGLETRTSLTSTSFSSLSTGPTLLTKLQVVRTTLVTGSELRSPSPTSTVPSMPSSHSVSLTRASARPLPSLDLSMESKPVSTNSSRPSTRSDLERMASQRRMVTHPSTLGKLSGLLPMKTASWVSTEQPPPELSPASVSSLTWAA